MKSYAETQKQEVVDWNEFLREAQDADDMGPATDLADGWVTCACGQACEAIKRDDWGSPADAELKALGYNFGCFISAMSGSEGYEFDENRAKAQACLLKIEQRAAELLAEIEKGD